MPQIKIFGREAARSNVEYDFQVLPVTKLCFLLKVYPRPALGLVQRQALGYVGSMAGESCLSNIFGMLINTILYLKSLPKRLKRDIYCAAQTKKDISLFLCKYRVHW